MRTRASLAAVTGVAGAVPGGLTALGGMALTLALFSTDQPPGQTATAAVLSLTGIVNVLASRGIRDEWQSCRRRLWQNPDIQEGEPR